MPWPTSWDALSIVEELSGNMARHLRKQLRREKHSLNSASQTASMANVGIKYVSIAMVDVSARVAHGGLCSFRTQALQVGMSATGGRDDALSKYASGISLNSKSLFIGHLGSAFAKTASFACDYVTMVDSFGQVGQQLPKPPRGPK